jgi:hypothetical protein
MYAQKTVKMLKKPQREYSSSELVGIRIPTCLENRPVPNKASPKSSSRNAGLLLPWTEMEDGVEPS